MAASDHVNPQQLRMFMTARELYNTHSIDVPLHPEARFGGHWKTMDAMWKTKRKENRTNNVPEAIAKHGVHMPVTLAHGDRDFGGATVIEHGHHRIEAAYRHDPEMYLPVEHEDYDLPRYRPSVAEQNEHARRIGAIPDWTEHQYFPSYP